jgi:hypothetical protein
MNLNSQLFLMNLGNGSIPFRNRTDYLSYESVLLAR